MYYVVVRLTSDTYVEIREMKDEGEQLLPQAQGPLLGVTEY
jgi:hypothetical protein